MAFAGGPGLARLQRRPLPAGGPLALGAWRRGIVKNVYWMLQLRRVASLGFCCLLFLFYLLELEINTLNRKNEA